MLKISNLKKSYGQLQAVKGIDLYIEKGEIIGLLGPNGAGKSTTISMISTLIKPDAGLIEFKETDVLKDPKPIQKVLGIVPQEIALYPTLTGYENLKFWGHAYGLKGHELKKRIEEVSEIIGIKDRLKDKVEKYSGGMKRRINIGAALLHKPELLIMDEPTVGIDPQSRNHILETIKSLNEEGMSIIYTSHYMEEVEFLCDRIYIMDEGQVIASGTKDSLVSSINGDRKVIVSFAKDPNGIKDVLEKNAHVDKVTVDQNQLTVYTKKKENLIKEVVEASSQFDIEMTSIDVENPNLETVFLKLTGKALRD
ncbi:ABC transporter ATP-binding protein [Acidaminobacter sp. JC074]|uniref:ABC transporter ATP-binding protein n=1 Tax=Acidaminobacter sp. JC074 TaxID=2530199 RepID=UPI001F0DF3A5|nr:ABC transporter ATP-binding protein [Acidaminobacter sp. JC074]MCH4889895.1 ABC transporter ATP-binding protein [Acidaminobacter sp. JC074]